MNSSDLIAKVQACTFAPGTRFVKCDVDDYFMTGDHAVLLEQSCKAVALEWREQYREMLEFILKNQFIVPPYDNIADGFVWRARKGSGMGAICSGEVSNTSLHYLCEHFFISSPEVRARYGLAGYWRFKDDIMLAFDRGRELMLELMALYKEKARPFTITCESVSRTTVVTLDVRLTVGQSGRMSYELYRKPTSQWSPLSVHSCHPHAIHASWPRGQVMRLRRLCSDTSKAAIEVTSFTNALRAGGAPLSIIEMATARAIPRHPISTSRTIRLVLPYREALRRARVPAILLKYLQPHTACAVAWRLLDRHVVDRVRRHAAVYHGDEWENYPTLF